MSGSVAAWCAKLDFDSIFAYSVPRTVSIRDRTLGILQYLCMLLIVLYIVGDTVVYEQRYRLVATDIFGSARLQLVGPPTAFAQLPNETSYCEGSVSPYTGQPPIVMFPCRYLNTYAMVYPEEEASAMLIATRITETNYTRDPNCDTFPVPSCGYVETGSTSYYVGGPVDLSTLKIDHTMTSQMLGISKTSTQMDGKIMKGKERIDPKDDFRNAPCSATIGGSACAVPSFVNFGTQGQPDIIALRTLLRAADAENLEEGDYVANSTTGVIESRRNAGIVLLVSIIYSNAYTDTGSWDLNYYSYTLRASFVPETQFKVEQVLPAPGKDTVDGRQTILDRHGIRVIIKQSGNVGSFDTATLLITLTSSLGLLAVAATIVSFVARYLLPLRHVYRQYMAAQTVDFGAMRRLLPEAELARFAKEDLINPLPPIFETAGVPAPWEAPVDDAAAPGAATKAGGGGSAGSRGLEMGEPLLDDPGLDEGGTGLKRRLN